MRGAGRAQALPGEKWGLTPDRSGGRSPPGQDAMAGQAGSVPPPETPSVCKELVPWCPQGPETGGWPSADTMPSQGKRAVLENHLPYRKN